MRVTAATGRAANALDARRIVSVPATMREPTEIRTLLRGDAGRPNCSVTTMPNGDGGQHRALEAMQSMVKRIARTGQRLQDWELRLLCAPCHRFITNGLSLERVALLVAESNDWPFFACRAAEA